MKSKISPSMMCTDILEFSKTLKILEKEKIEYLHIDVMDGQFVPNFMLGTDFIKNMRKISNIPLDIHLMINKPEDKIEWFDFCEGEYVSVHAESTNHLQKVLIKLRDMGIKPMVAINPATPLIAIEEVLVDVDGVLVMTVNPGFSGQKLVIQTLDKISRLRKILNERNLNHVEIEVDGNVSLENAIKMKKAGANIFVVGTSCLFNGGNIEENIKAFRKNVDFGG